MARSHGDIGYIQGEEADARSARVTRAIHRPDLEKVGAALEGGFESVLEHITDVGKVAGLIQIVFIMAHT